MDFIKRSLACSHCSRTLQSPVTLICGATICKHHVDSAIIGNEYVCGSCYSVHSRPEGDFRINEILENILRSKLSSLHFGDEYQSAVDAVAKLEDLISRYHLLKNDPHYEIYELVADFKNSIDLKREHLKLEIDVKAEKLIQRVVDYENACKKMAAKLDFERMDEKVAAIEYKIEKSKQELSVLEINKQKWNNITWSLETQFELLNEQFNTMRSELLLNNHNNFCDKHLNLSICEDNLRYRRIELTVNGCSKYKERKLKSFEKAVFDPKLDLDWTLTVQLVKKGDKSSRVDIYLESSKQYKYAGKLIANAQLKLWNRKDASKDLIHCLTYDLSEESALGFTFIKLRDLLKDEEFYNAYEDSFTVEVLITTVVDKR